MSEAEKSKQPKPISDVAKPGKSAPSDTSRSIITSRPIMQDPMVVDPDAGSDVETSTTKDVAPSTSSEKTIPTTREAKKVELKSDDTVAELAEKAKVEQEERQEAEAIKEAEQKEKAKEETSTEDKTDDKADTKDETDDKAPTDQPDLEAEATKQAEHEANVQKIIDSKKYSLPITTTEKRRSTRNIVLGILLALVLTLVWVDIALDASLFKIPGVKPVTHIFSN